MSTSTTSPTAANRAGFRFEEEKQSEYLNGIYYLGQFLWKRRSEPSSDDLKLVGAELKLCVDTALLKIYVELMDKKYKQINQDLASSAPFYIEDLLDYEVENACVESECGRVLAEAHQYYNLALFYRSKRKLAQALKTLHKIGETKEWKGDEQQAIDLTINILSLMREQEADLWTCSKWVLLKSPHDAMAIFTHSKRCLMDNALYLDFDRVLNYLHEDIVADIDDYDEVQYFDYKECYLEFIVNKCQSTDAKYHDSLAYLYMAKISKLSSMHATTRASMLANTREKLLKFLEKSQYIAPAKLLQHAKKFQLYDEIIELNKKLKNHNAVLYTLLIDKTDHQSAINYCMQTAPSSKDRSDRFLELLRLYFTHSMEPHANDQKHVQGTDEQAQPVDEDEEDAIRKKEPTHRKQQTLNMELLQQAFGDANHREFDFMQSDIGKQGMEFDADEHAVAGHGYQAGALREEDDEDEEEEADEQQFNVVDSDHEFFQISRSRNERVVSPRRRGAISLGNKDESDDKLAKEREKIDRKLFFDKGCEILYEYAFDMDYLRVLELLPPKMDVMHLQRYIVKIIPYVVHKRRMTQIKKNLHKTQYIRQTSQLAKVKSQYFKMDYSSVCAKCQKPIGSSVFILDPHSFKKKYHYSCFYRKRPAKNNEVITNQHMVSMTEHTDYGVNHDHDALRNEHIMTPHHGADALNTVEHQISFHAEDAKNEDNEFNPFVTSNATTTTGMEAANVHTTNTNTDTASIDIQPLPFSNPFDAAVNSNSKTDTNPFAAVSTEIESVNVDNNASTNPFGVGVASNNDGSNNPFASTNSGNTSNAKNGNTNPFQPQFDNTNPFD